MSTIYHAKYFAHELTKRCSADSVEKLAGATAGAQVDLNPHQVDAAQDKVDTQCGEIISQLENKLTQQISEESLLGSRWGLR